MKWPRELKTLLPPGRKLVQEYALSCLFKSAALIMGFNALFNLAAVLWPSLPSWRLPLSLAAILPAVVYFWKYRPTTLSLARQLDDKLDSRERIQTILEVYGQNEKIEPYLLGETCRYLEANPPMVKTDLRRMLRWLPHFLLATALFLSTWLVSPSLSESIQQSRETGEARDEAIEAVEELATLLPDEPLLEELFRELEHIKEQLAKSETAAEAEVLLREAAELLEKSREELAETAAALQRLEELTGEKSAGEISDLLQDDSHFRGELLEQLMRLQGNLSDIPMGALLEQAINDIASAPERLSSEQIEQLLQQLSSVNPSGARQAVEQGMAQFQQRRSGTPGDGSPSGVDNGNGSPAGNGNGAEGSGEGGAGGNGGENGSGNGGAGGEEGSAGGGEGSGGGQGYGSNGAPGDGAGTGSSSPLHHDFFFIPGDQEVLLGGEGEEGNYTLREILRFNPALALDSYTGFYQSYYTQGISSINRGEVPKPLESYLRDYFQAISP